MSSVYIFSPFDPQLWPFDFFVSYLELFPAIWRWINTRPWLDKWNRFSNTFKFSLWYLICSFEFSDPNLKSWKIDLDAKVSFEKRLDCVLYSGPISYDTFSLIKNKTLVLKRTYTASIKMYQNEWIQQSGYGILSS